MERLGKIKAVRLPAEDEQPTSFAGCGPQFLSERLEIDLDADTTVTSTAYLTGMHDNFVKIRASYRRGDAASAATVDDFVANLHNVPGGCAP
jgi:hypothetical protein